VRALPPVAAPRVTAAGRTSRVDGTAAGRCEGHEHLGMLGNRGGYFMVSAAKAGVDELPSVTGVGLSRMGTRLRGGCCTG
jgi:hypothetical protein